MWAGNKVIQNKVILCIDDNEAILQYEKALLEMSGYAVLTATSGRAAIPLVTMREIDGVLLDYDMPEMNGFEVALEIRRMKPDLAIILMSGSDVPTDALSLVDAFLLKLETSRALLPMIDDLCNRTRHPQQNGPER